MESQHNQQQQPHWLALYNRENHTLDLSNYQLKLYKYHVSIVFIVIIVLSQICKQQVNLYKQLIKLIFSVGWIQLTVEDIKDIIRIKMIDHQQLRVANLQYQGGCKIGDEGCKHLSQAKWPNLQEIYLCYNEIGAQGCKHLSQVNWSNLQELYLNRNQIEDQGCKHLSQANWPNLEILYLNDNHIGDEGFKLILTYKWRNLKQLHLCCNQLINGEYWRDYIESVPIRNQINQIIDIDQ